MNKSLLTAFVGNSGNTGSCGCVSSAVNNINVSWLNFNNTNHGYNRFKEITYIYDLISGKVNEVDYQPGAVDQFYHRYDYDAENRLTDVYTSDNKAYIGHKNLEEHEAFYEYYKHGPLARSVIGQQQVQGIDYAYTLEGWLKGVNSTSLNPVYDMGADGLPSPGGAGGGLVARDAYSFGLNYFTGDYSPINSTVSPFPGFSGLFPTGYSYKPLYNGNISAMSVNIGKLNNPLLYNYQYDQLNRLVAMDAFTGLNETNNTWNALTTDNSYQERLSYDANGNIKTYLRNGTSATLNLNNYNYTYQSGSNRLLSIQNSVNSQTSNYDYDAIGNVIKDDKQNVTANEWNVYGKLQSTQKADGTNVTYTYNSSGNRISKTVSGANGYTEWYVLDASGNMMAVYTVTGSDSLYQSEQHLYGSNRLGIFDRNLNADAALPAGISANLIGKYYVSFSTRGKKRYEFSDQRGSVLLTASDKKIPYSSNGSTIDYYNADIISATDYSTFGAISRSFNAVVATNAFDGQRRSPEISATAQTAQFWEYNGDVGRRWNLDPITFVDSLAGKSLQISPYASMLNNPILKFDVKGDSSEDIIVKGKNNSSLTLKTDIVNVTIKTNIDFGSNTTISDLSHVAVGYQTSGTATSSAAIGQSGNISKISTLFLGGRDAGYWYDYIGAEGQAVVATGAEASVGVAKSWFIAFNNASETNNAPGFAGRYYGGGVSFHTKDFLAGLSVTAQYSVSTDRTWSVLSLGTSLSAGPQIDFMAGFGVSGEGHMGATKLLTTEKPTSERHWWDIGGNWLTHLIF